MTPFRLMTGHLRCARAGRDPRLPAVLLALAVSYPVQAVPQDSNVLYPVTYIEERLGAPELQILDIEPARDPSLAERSQRVTLAGIDGEPPLEAHWKPVAPPGQGFNNEPRYELAAYRFQRMFLEEDEFVVPPAVLRAMAIEEYRELRPAPGPTIPGTRSVLFLLTYWIQNLAVDTVDPFDPQLFSGHEGYAHHFANANILTHLIDHKDGNHGNLLVSLDGMNPRVFSVDNDVAFRSGMSDRGDRWRRLHVDRLPSTTIERLRTLTRGQLDRELGVVAEFALLDGLLVPVESGENLNPRRGVRVSDGRVQFGLTTREIDDLERRIRNLLGQVDRGRLQTF
jgi:hypothetical protein